MCEDNKIIAEFMGIEDNELYHSEWNWLMPVVNRIESLKPKISNIEIESIIFTIEEEHTYISMESTEGITISTIFYNDGPKRIVNTYKTVLEFIKAYNNKSIIPKDDIYCPVCHESYSKESEGHDYDMVKSVGECIICKEYCIYCVNIDFSLGDIILNFKQGHTEPLDGDLVEELVDQIKVCINEHEGNE